MTPAIVARRFVPHLRCLHRQCSVVCCFMWRGVGTGVVAGCGTAEEQLCRWSEQWGSWQLPGFKEVPIVTASRSIQAVEQAAVWRITTANSPLIKQSDAVINVLWLNYFPWAALEKHSQQQVYWLFSWWPFHCAHMPARKLSVSGSFSGSLMSWYITFWPSYLIWEMLG